MPFIAGIIWLLATTINISVTTLLWLALICFAGLLFSFYLLRSNYSLRWIAGLFSNLSLFILGACMVACSNIRNQSLEEPSAKPINEKVYLCRIDAAPVQKSRSTAGIAWLIAELDSLKSWSPVKKKILVYFKGDSLNKSLKYGDLIIISGDLQSFAGPQNPHMFNYRQYLINRQIYCQVFLEPGRWRSLGRTRSNPIKSVAEECREKCLEIFRKFKVDGQDFALVSALLLGRTEYLEKEIMKEFSHAGVIHVLSVSGLHVGIMYVVADRLFFFLKRGRKSRKAHQILILVCIWAYAFIAGLPSSVVRAALMFSLIAAGKMFKRSSESYNIVAVAAFLQLIINPYDITQVGFQLSYVAVLGIFAFYKPVNEMISPSNRISAGIWSILAVSMAAQLATFPLACHYFNMFPVYFLLTNLIVVPLAAVITYFAVFLLAAGAAGMTFEWLALPLKWSLRFMSGSVEYIQSWPGAVIEPINLPTWQVILVYSAIAGIFIFWVLDFRKGAFIAIASLLVFFMLADKNLYEQMQTSEIAVYQVSGHTAIDLFHQHQAYFICDSALMADPGKIEFQVKPNRINGGIRDVRVINIKEKATLSYPGAWVNYPFIFFNGKRIAIVDSQWKNRLPGETISCDVIIYSGNSGINPENLIKQVRMDKVIIDSSVPFYRADQLMQFFRKEGIPFHSVRQEGAFVMQWI
jgi:competence protein ComEC